jgi:hypothetical protein
MTSEIRTRHDAVLAKLDTHHRFVFSAALKGYITQSDVDFSEQLGEEVCQEMLKLAQAAEDDGHLLAAEKLRQFAARRPRLTVTPR